MGRSLTPPWTSRGECGAALAGQALTPLGKEADRDAGERLPLDAHCCFGAVTAQGRG